MFYILVFYYSPYGGILNKLKMTWQMTPESSIVELYLYFSTSASGYNYIFRQYILFASFTLIILFIHIISTVSMESITSLSLNMSVIIIVCNGIKANKCQLRSNLPATVKCVFLCSITNMGLTLINETPRLLCHIYTHP